MPDLTPAAQLLATIAALRSKGALRRQLVHLEAWRDGQRVSVPHLLIDGNLVALTDAQIQDLKE